MLRPTFESISRQIAAARGRAQVRPEEAGKRILGLLPNLLPFEGVPAPALSRRGFTLRGPAEIETHLLVAPGVSLLTLAWWSGGGRRGLLLWVQPGGAAPQFAAEFSLDGGRLTGYVDLLAPAERRDPAWDEVLLPGETGRLRFEARAAPPPWRAAVASAAARDFDLDPLDFEAVSEGIMLLVSRYLRRLAEVDPPGEPLRLPAELLAGGPTTRAVEEMFGSPWALGFRQTIMGT